MRIALLSDLHLSAAPMPFPQVEADVIVLAGDLGRPAQAIEWARATPLPTLYVAGNHEFYGSDLVSTHQALARLAAGSPLQILERSEWIHQGVRFLGCTLWSDFRIFNSETARLQGVQAALNFTRDYTRIRVAPDFPDTFSPALAQLLFLESVKWLEACFSRPHPGPTVVITHFAPSQRSIAPQFAGSPVNACFVSDLDAHILRWQPALWLHGHTHDSFDYRIGSTRIVCNPRGYARRTTPDGPLELENARFNPGLVLTL